MTRGALRATAVAGRSLRLAYEGFGLLFPLAFVPAAALAAVTYALTGGPEASPRDPGALAALAANLVGSFVVTGIMCLAALDVASGKRRSLGQYLARTLRHLGPIVALGVLLSVATGLALVLFVIPGLYVAARFLPWAPAIVFEGAGWSGLGRAQDLTAGHRWPIVGALVLLSLAGLAAAAALLPVLAMAQGNALLGVLADALLSALVYVVASTLGAVAYLDLRDVKEGLSATEVAATID